DGTTAATLNIGSAALVGVIGSDNVALSGGGASGTFASKNVGTSIVVSVTGLTLNGTDAVNYALSVPVTTTANITEASTLSQVTSSLNPALPGSNITFTCTLSSAGTSTDKPSGTVTFKDG